MRSDSVGGCFVQNDPKWAYLKGLRNPKSRLRKFVDACKGKTECPHTGQAQPSFRLLEGKIYAEYKERHRDYDDGPSDAAERKQARQA